MTTEINSSITVTVRMIGFLRKWREDKNPQVKVQAGITIYELLDQFVVQDEEEFHAALWDRSGQMHGGLELILNGQVISPSQIRNIKIMEDSELTIIPVIAGGGYPYHKNKERR